jgi:hypothetical protein
MFSARLRIRRMLGISALPPGTYRDAMTTSAEWRASHMLRMNVGGCD